MVGVLLQHNRKVCNRLVQPAHALQDNAAVVSRVHVIGVAIEDAIVVQQGLFEAACGAVSYELQACTRSCRRQRLFAAQLPSYYVSMYLCSVVRSCRRVPFFMYEDARTINARPSPGRAAILAVHISTSLSNSAVFFRLMR